jgi:hypothetical protein
MTKKTDRPARSKKEPEVLPRRGQRIEKVHRKIIPMAPYHTCSLLVIGGTAEQAAQEARRFLDCNIPRVPDANGRLFFVAGRFGFVLWIPWIPDTISQLGTVCHEAGHAATHTLMAAGFEIGEKREGGPNDEPLAYLADYVFSQVLHFGQEIEIRCEKAAKPKKRR